jgi:hypothetical protein
MTVLADAMNALFDALCAPFAGVPAIGVLVLSLLIGVVMLLLFKWSTNQDRLVAARRVLTGRVYEMGLFQDHLGVLMRIQKDLLVANLRYLRWSLPALVVIIVPMVLILAQLDARYGHRPLRPGETTLVTAKVDAAEAGVLETIALTATDGVTVEAGPVRDRSLGTATWRIRIDAAGEHNVAVVLPDGTEAGKRVPAGEGTPRLAGTRERESLARTFLNPAEAPLPGDMPLRAIAVELPPRDLDYLGVRTNWLVALCVFSILFGLAVKDLFRVRF